MPSAKFSVTIVASAVLLGGSGVLAADPPRPAAPVSTETVIVTAPRVPLDPRQVDATIHRFVESHAALSYIEQMPRWVAAVCPVTEGLPQAFDTFISNRIETIARGAGAPTGQPCKPNIEIVFTAEPQKIMDQVARRDPQLLGYHYVSQTENLARVSRPVQAWYVTATRNGSGAESVDNPYSPSVSGGAGSRMSHGLKSVFRQVLIVADLGKVGDREVGPIADYIALLALTEVHAPDDCAALPSILDLMSGGCTAAAKPSALTETDLSFLKGLYSMNASLIGPMERHEVLLDMKHDMSGR